MVLSVKRSLALALCAATFASEVTQTSSLHTQSRRNLAGIHHTTKYAPSVVKQPEDNPEQKDSTSDNEYGSHDLSNSTGTITVDPSTVSEVDIDSSQALDVELEDSADVDVDMSLSDRENLDYSSDADQEIELSSSRALDIDATAILDSSAALDAEAYFKNGSANIELENGEDYVQDLELDENENVEEDIEIPEGAKSIHLRMHEGNVDLEIIKVAEPDMDKKTPSKENVEHPQDEQKGEQMTEEDQKIDPEEEYKKEHSEKEPEKEKPLEEEKNEQPHEQEEKEEVQDTSKETKEERCLANEEYISLRVVAVKYTTALPESRDCGILTFLYSTKMFFIEMNLSVLVYLKT
ncbi:hypothetical protein PsorP6_013617 [Peronosclerospora sorghi]|uniref:Uncharacterized protein n=1 Tax=Peronosclerospora sorghi TaxID=230839 RepID=A0ACC0VJI8_9STRA|nr:hypothetical protein PsorP6_013617 [Peronosclerospora sorghi]